MASNPGDNRNAAKQGKPGAPGYPRHEHGAHTNAAPRQHLQDLNQDSQNLGKTPFPLQPGVPGQGGNGSQDRRPAMASGNMNRAASATEYDSSVLYEDDRPR